MVPQAVSPVEPVCALVRAGQRFFRTHVNRNISAAKLGSVERISRALLYADISGNGGDGQNLDARRAQRHDEGHGIIGSRIGINQEGGFHAA
jgi:hypothetical protein